MYRAKQDLHIIAFQLPLISAQTSVKNSLVGLVVMTCVITTRQAKHCCCRPLSLFLAHICFMNCVQLEQNDLTR